MKNKNNPQFSTKPTLFVVGPGREYEAVVDVTAGEHTQTYLDFYDGKTDREVQLEAMKATFPAEIKNPILSGKARMQLMAAGLLVKGEDKRYQVVG